MSSNLTETAKPMLNELACCIDCGRRFEGMTVALAASVITKLATTSLRRSAHCEDETASSRPSTTVQAGSAFASGNGCS